MATSLTPMDQVLSSVELLEQILLRLPIRTLLLAQRVNKKFHGTITSSPSLQEALFFRPIPSKYQEPEFNLPPNPSLEKPKLNPLLYTCFPCFYDIWRTLAGFNDSIGFDWEVRFFEMTKWYQDVDWNIEEPKLELELGASGKGDESRQRHADRWRRKEASWRRMLLCQPSVELLRVHDCVQDEGGDSFNTVAVGFCSDEVERMKKGRGKVKFVRKETVCGSENKPNDGQGDESKEERYFDAAEIDIVYCQSSPVLKAGILYDLVTAKLLLDTGREMPTLEFLWGMFDSQHDLNAHVDIEGSDSSFLIPEPPFRRQRSNVRTYQRNALTVAFSSVSQCVFMEDEEAKEGAAVPEKVMKSDGMDVLSELKGVVDSR